MGKAKGINRFTELYAYFEKHPDRYFIEKLSCEGKQIISVSFRSPISGKPLKVVRIKPELHEKLCKYTFKGIEVSWPTLTIDENTKKALVETLLLPPDIFS